MGFGRNTDLPAATLSSQTFGSRSAVESSFLRVCAAIVQSAFHKGSSPCTQRVALCMSKMAALKLHILLKSSQRQPSILHWTT
jgi:hypothetical protein